VKEGLKKRQFSASCGLASPASTFWPSLLGFRVSTLILDVGFSAFCLGCGALVESNMITTGRANLGTYQILARSPRLPPLEIGVDLLGLDESIYGHILVCFEISSNVKVVKFQSGQVR